MIKICMNDRVAEGARRLLENAAQIRAVVDLRGCCLALDDCYEVWDSGFISIPYDFAIHELPEKVRMLKAGQRPSTSGGGEPGPGAARAESLQPRSRGGVAQAAAGAPSRRSMQPSSGLPGGGSGSGVLRFHAKNGLRSGQRPALLRHSLAPPQRHCLASASKGALMVKAASRMGQFALRM